eukprot:SAG22_NODE_11369_length_488_cov_0.946015_3_plen_29_part_01
MTVEEEEAATVTTVPPLSTHRPISASRRR